MNSTNQFKENVQNKYSTTFKRKSTPYSPRLGTPSRKLLRNILEKHQIKLNPDSLSLLWKYHQLLRKHNTDSDLSRLHSFNTIILKHYVDCLIIPKKLQIDLPSPLIDIGTGAGFPGIILKIIFPELPIILAEPRPKKVLFLNTVIKDLHLSNITVFNHRVTPESLTIPVEACICRAFSKVSDTLERVQNSLTIGGKVIFMKGPALKEELEALPKNYLKNTGYKIEQKTFFTLPQSEQNRSLLVLKKVR